MKLLKNKKVKIVFGIILLVGGYLLYRHYSDKNQTVSEEQINIPVEVKRGNIKETVSASGQIETANYLAVTTSVNGIVKKVFVSEGDVVTKGQSIMEITLNSDGEESRASAWASYLSAKSSLESAKNQLITLETALINAEEDFEDEKEQNSYQTHDERIAYTLAENAWEVAKFNYDSQEDSIAQKQIALNKAWLTYQAQSPTIVAPSSGTIANIVVVEGMEITNSLSERTSSTVASIRNEGSPIASVNISEVDINKIEVGQKAELTLNSIKDTIFTGMVVGIDKIGVSSSGVSNYPVIIKFDENSDEVLPNMGVDADIIIQEKENVLYVPSAAILSMRGNTMLRVNGQERPVQVETGISTNDYTEIISGVEEGTEILMTTLPTNGFTSTSDSNEQDRPRGVFFGPGGGR
ncbi:efflux RND transporter periplasmic adaptor subunit [Patescibacteria group bacterium]|nr:efflux RND transporter periplasmic adaptor subunit [Patescibacteria group bacterium]